MTFGGGVVDGIVVNAPAGWVSGGTAMYAGNRIYLSGVDTGAALNAVPEPGTMALLFLGVLGAMAMLRRRIRQ